MAYPITPMGGVNINVFDTTPQFKLGVEHTDENGTTYQYLKNPVYSSIVPNILYEVNPANFNLRSAPSIAWTLPTNFAVPLQTATAINDAAYTSAKGATYGWYAVRGPMSIVQNANLTVGNKVYAGTGLGGRVTTSGTLLHGVTPTATTTSGVGGLANVYAVINLCGNIAS